MIRRAKAADAQQQQQQTPVKGASGIPRPPSASSSPLPPVPLPPQMLNESKQQQQQPINDPMEEVDEEAKRRAQQRLDQMELEQFDREYAEKEKKLYEDEVNAFVKEWFAKAFWKVYRPDPFNPKAYPKHSELLRALLKSLIDVFPSAPPGLFCSVLHWIGFGFGVD